MTLDSDGKQRLAPDAAKGAPFTNNILPFPMARCKADEEILSPEQVQEIADWFIAVKKLNPQSRHASDAHHRVEKLVRTIAALGVATDQLIEERDHLCSQLEQADHLTACPVNGDF
jgi:hypothetical protein